jgi:hypothetical protein
MSKTAELAAYVAAIAQNTTGKHPDIIAQDALKLRRLATRHAWYCLQACNVGLTDEQEAAQEKLEDKMLTHVEENFPGVKVAFQHDPRGATVKLILPDGRSNSFAGGYWCVPISREW